MERVIQPTQRQRKAVNAVAFVHRYSILAADNPDQQAEYLRKRDYWMARYDRLTWWDRRA